MGRLDVPQISKAFFATVMPFRTEEGRARYDAHTFRSTVQEVLASQEAAAASRRVDFEIYDQARYAMVALVDELTIVSDWAYRNDWAQEPLELTIFNTNVAGEDFYERLTALKNRFSASRDEQEKETILGALEIFFTCIESGFKGRHRGGGEGELGAVRNGLLGLLWPESDSRKRKPLFPDAYAEGAEGRSARRRMSLWPFLIAASVILVVVLYLAFSFMLGSRAGKIEDVVEERAERALAAVEEDPR